MNRCFLYLASVMVAVLAVRAEETAGFDRYQVIVDRAPFGAVATGPNDVVPNFAERFSYTGCVPSVRTNQLLAIIFDTQSNQSELIGVGSMFGEGGGIKLVKIDAGGENSTVTIQKGLEVATLRLRPPDKTPPAAAGAPANPVVAGQPTETPGKTVVVPARRRIPFRRGQ